MQTAYRLHRGSPHIAVACSCRLATASCAARNGSDRVNCARHRQSFSPSETLESSDNSYFEITIQLETNTSRELKLCVQYIYCTNLNARLRSQTIY